MAQDEFWDAFRPPCQRACMQDTKRNGFPVGLPPTYDHTINKLKIMCLCVFVLFIFCLFHHGCYRNGPILIHSETPSHGRYIHTVPLQNTTSNHYNKLKPYHTMENQHQLELITIHSKHSTSIEMLLCNR